MALVHTQDATLCVITDCSASNVNVIDKVLGFFKQVYMHLLVLSLQGTDIASSYAMTTLNVPFTPASKQQLVTSEHGWPVAHEHP